MYTLKLSEMYPNVTVYKILLTPMTAADFSKLNIIKNYFQHRICQELTSLPTLKYKYTNIVKSINLMT